MQAVVFHLSKPQDERLPQSSQLSISSASVWCNWDNARQLCWVLYIQTLLVLIFFTVTILLFFSARNDEGLYLSNSQSTHTLNIYINVCLHILPSWLFMPLPEISPIFPSYELKKHWQNWWFNMGKCNLSSFSCRFLEFENLPLFILVFDQLRLLIYASFTKPTAFHFFPTVEKRLFSLIAYLWSSFFFLPMLTVL